MSTPERYLELVELAGCSPYAPMAANPPGFEHDPGQAARYLATRLAQRGHRVTVTECRSALEAWLESPCPFSVRFESVTVGCDQLAGHKTPHQANIEAECTIYVDGHPRPSNRSVFLRW
jgi:hypothetical protein